MNFLRYSRRFAVANACPSIGQSSLQPKPSVLGLPTWTKLTTPTIYEAIPEPKKIYKTVTNWSGTHRVSTPRYIEPASTAEANRLIRQCNDDNIKIRAVGSAMSPNGISFSNSAMVNMVKCNKILDIDDTGRVTVEAGCNLRELLEAIRPHGLTLENVGSTIDQQVGGFLQVGTHATGATIPPCDMQIVSMKIATPEFGVIHLSEDLDSDLFHLARVGLGAFGVVTEVTIQCVPSHRLKEETVVLSHEEAVLRRDEFVGKHRHVRFMWIPFTDSVVVVSSNPTDRSMGSSGVVYSGEPIGSTATEMSEEERLQPMSDYLRAVYADAGLSLSAANTALSGQSFAGIRDLLLAAVPGPLDTEHVKRINIAEAQYWKNCFGGQEDTSDRILTFDCGGQQWVYEICFSAGPLGQSNGKDVAFVRELLEIVEEENIPAPSPIEQRWTARSTSKLSPAFSEDEKEVFSWVGIIMYLPMRDDRMRQHVTNEFRAYSRVVDRLCDKYGAVGHWAKIETQLLSRDERQMLQTRLGRRYKHMDEWKRAQRRVDPKGIMVNDVVADCFGL